MINLVFGVGLVFAFILLVRMAKGAPQPRRRGEDSGGWAGDEGGDSDGGDGDGGGD